MASKRIAIKQFGAITAGTTTVMVQLPTAAEREARVRESRRVISKLPRALSSPDVKVEFKATTPIYEVAPSNTKLVMQKIGNLVSCGVFKNGRLVKMP